MLKKRDDKIKEKPLEKMVLYEDMSLLQDCRWRY